MDLQATDYGSYVCPDDPGEPTTGVRRISITDEECRILNVLARGKTVLEIGTGLGISTRALAGGAKAVYTVDIDPWVRDNIFPDLPDNVMSCWFNIDADSEREPEWISDIPGEFDLVFIDAEHATDAVTIDLNWADQVVGLDGMIVCHDAKIAEVRAGCEKFGSDWYYVETHHGLAIRIG